MTDAESFEFIVVMIEIGAFMLVITLEAVVLEVIVPKLVKLVKRITVRIKLRKIKRRIVAGIKVQSG